LLVTNNSSLIIVHCLSFIIYPESVKGLITRVDCTRGGRYTQNMASLTETAYYARKTIHYGILALVFLIVGKIVLNLAIDIYRKINPPPPPPPTVGFGKLPAIEFPSKDRPRLTLKLETISDALPEFDDQTKVYLMPVALPNLLGLERATQVAAKLGFLFEPVAQSNRLFEFNKASPVPSRLEYDIITGNFLLHVAWFNDPDFLKQKFLPSEPQAIAEAKGYLRTAELLAEGLAESDVTVTPLKAKGIELERAVSLSEADFIQIDLFRQPLEADKPNITPVKTEGVVRVIISGSREQGERVIYTKYDYYPVNAAGFETYPLKTTQAAWEELMNGSGYIVSSDKNEGQATVRSVKLGYFDAYEPQNYFQPVYIFEGDDNFTAVVPAIDPVWIQ